MSKTKAVKPPKAPKEPKAPCKSLFDHLDAIYAKQDPNYFNTLSDADKKTWSNYMINRFISMNSNQIDIVNYIQRYTTIPPEMLYRFYIDMIPRGRKFNKYVKNSIEEKYDGQLVDLMVEYFECSLKEAKEYLDILSEEHTISICKKFGMSSKEIKKLL